MSAVASRMWPLQPQRQPQRAVLRHRSGWTVDVGHGKYRANYHAYRIGRTLTPARSQESAIRRETLANGKSSQPPRPTPDKECNRQNIQPPRHRLTGNLLETGPTATPSPVREANRNNHPLILSSSKDHLGQPWVRPWRIEGSSCRTSVPRPSSPKVGKRLTL